MGVTQDDVDKLTNPDNLDDEDNMIPIDMRAVDGDFGDVEELVTKLGLKGTVEAFVKARDYFVANKDGEPEEDRAKNMTAREWKDILMDDGGLEDMEEELFEGEEEEFLDDEDEDGGDDEPAAKKAKTD